MSPLSLSLLATLSVTLAAMLLLWVIATRRRNVTLVDVWWGLGFIAIVWTAVALNTAASRSILSAVFVTVWGRRLAVHLGRRSAGQPEDRRYAAMRAHHGARFWWVSLFTVFLLQGLLMWIISLPLQITAVAGGPDRLTATDVLGGLLWIAGFLFETVGDAQLVRFRRDPASHGRVLDRGLWRYTRHPNYFGEFLMWWGLYLLSLAAGGSWTIFAPLLMTILLLRVSGVTLLEANIADRRPDYAEYRRCTNAFFPGPRRAGRS
jgi:steroid 5-alpha reductase family enzyme